MEEEEESDDEEEKPWYENLVIDSENSLKGIHDINMIFIICYSCITAFYYFGFESPSNQYWIYWDNFVDFYFYLDFILCFFTSTKDPRTFQDIDTLKEITMNYL